MTKQIRDEVWGMKKFMKVPENPVQRNTEEHARKALRYHMKEAKPIHAFVHVAELPSGKQFILDGHTRRYLWDKGLLDAPDKIQAKIIPVPNMDEVEEAYKWFDNAKAVETVRDKMYGTLRKNGLRPQSSLLLTGGLKSAIITVKSACGATTVEHFVSQNVNVLSAIDVQMYTKTLVTTPVLSAMILTFRRDPKVAASFWDDYTDSRMTIDYRGRSSVAMASHYFDARQKVGGGGAGMSESNAKLLQQFLGCYEGYMRGSFYTKGGPPRVSINEFVRRCGWV